MIPASTQKKCGDGAREGTAQAERPHPSPWLSHRGARRGRGKGQGSPRPPASERQRGPPRARRSAGRRRDAPDPGALEQPEAPGRAEDPPSQSAGRHLPPRPAPRAASPRSKAHSAQNRGLSKGACALLPPQEATEDVPGEPGVLRDSDARRAAAPAGSGGLGRATTQRQSPRSPAGREAQGALEGRRVRGPEETAARVPGTGAARGLPGVARGGHEVDGQAPRAAGLAWRTGR